MAIRHKLIHFKTFENFNSKKLSANAENTKYTVGVGGSVTTGAPDILYQSICWIKDTKQQWTHGELYDCDMGDVKPYVAFFTLDEIQQLAESGESRQCDLQDYMGILDAVESGRPILIPNGYASGGYATVVNKIIDDCIYLTVVGDVAGGAPRFYDVNVYEGEVVATEITYQNELVSGTTIKTVNGQSLLGSGDIVTSHEEDFPYYLAVELSDIVESAENGVPFEYYESGYEELRTAIDQSRMVLIENLYDGRGKAVVVNQIASDMVYLTLVANLSSDATPRFYAVEIDGRAGTAREITYQQALVSGTNIKTINGNSILGSGNLNISDIYITNFTLEEIVAANDTGEGRFQNPYLLDLMEAIKAQKTILVPNDSASNTGYATVVQSNYETQNIYVLGYILDTVRYFELYINYTSSSIEIIELQFLKELVSGESIKTINNSSILGSGNLNVCKEPYIITNLTVSSIDNAVVNISGNNYFINIARPVDLLDAIRDRRLIYIPDTYGYLQPSRVTISDEYAVLDFTFIDTNDVSHIIRAFWDETYFDMYDFQTTGTITSVKMNGSTIAASGEVDLGNVASQDYVNNSISTSVTNTLNTEV